MTQTPVQKRESVRQDLEKTLGKEIIFQKRFKSEGQSFSAFNRAEKFLNFEDFTVGSMQRNEPIGIHRGEVHIPKWDNITNKSYLDGVMVSDDFRDGDVYVYLFESEDSDKLEKLVQEIEDEAGPSNDNHLDVDGSSYEANVLKDIEDAHE